MKNLLLLAAMLLIFGSVNAQNAKKLCGKWKGSYFCTQGETGLTLKIKGRSNGDITGTFTFYPIPSNKNPMAKSGKFSFTGTYTSGKIILTQKKWIDQPEGYLMVDLEGELSDPKTISGKIMTPGCGDFKVVK